MQYQTKSERFVLSKKRQWEDLRRILERLQRNGFKALYRSEVSTFPRLFRLTCTDLAEAKMLQLSPDVIDYLNQLVGQAHKFLYSFPPLKKSQVKMFFRKELPSAIIKNWIYILISASIFFTSYAVSFAVVQHSPNMAAVIVPTSLLRQMEQSYREEISEKRSITLKNLAVSFYIENNVSIAFASFALGALLELGTVYILMYNGVFLGAISGHIVNRGYRDHFITFITAHSVAEITGLILAGAAGLIMGFSIIKATRYYRKEWLALQRQTIFTLLAASALLLFVAAFIEGVISPSPIPYRWKIATAVLSITAIIGYFIVWPLILRFRYLGWER